MQLYLYLIKTGMKNGSDKEIAMKRNRECDHQCHYLHAAEDNVCFHLAAVKNCNLNTLWKIILNFSWSHTEKSRGSAMWARWSGAVMDGLMIFKTSLCNSFIFWYIIVTKLILLARIFFLTENNLILRGVLDILIF